MRNIIFLFLSSIFLLGCSAGFKQSLPIRESYDQVKFGEPIPQSIEPASRVVIDDQQTLVGVSGKCEWKYSTGATEWAMYLLDADGSVIAKYYQVHGEEVNFPSYHIKRISEADWSWLMGPESVDPYAHAREICAVFQPEALGWTMRSIDVEGMNDEQGGPIAAASVLELAETKGSWVNGRVDFRYKVGFEKKPPLIERSVRYSLKSEGVVATMAECRQLCYSGAQWTAMGWAHAVRYGELP